MPVFASPLATIPSKNFSKSLGTAVKIWGLFAIKSSLMLSIPVSVMLTLLLMYK